MSSTPIPQGATNPSAGPFSFPTYYSFPPFFSPQPNAHTRLSQLRKWSSLIQAYCRHYRIYRLTLANAVETSLFQNKELQKRISLAEARKIIDWMASAEGEKRAEWIDGTKATAYIWWRRPEEWAEVISDWVELTGQRNTVLTLYELVEGEATLSQEFHGMEQPVMQAALNILVKRGKAQVFGSDDQQGVKIF
ncbi:hypothetical protein KEM55_002142 [Ascosphaera atra]|nr:hypothetical protein KEM55_002142 [Ascosphaera atra]